MQCQGNVNHFQEHGACFTGRLGYPMCRAIRNEAEGVKTGQQFWYFDAKYRLKTLFSVLYTSKPAIQLG